MPYPEYLLYKEFLRTKEEGIIKCMIWGICPEVTEEDRVKLAWVLINEGRQMIGVDNKTMKGYKMKEETPEIKFPLEPIEYDKFERWCTTFDL